MNIYYSRSNNVDDAVVGRHIEALLNQMPSDIRNEINLSKYSPKNLEEADIVIINVETYRETHLGDGYIIGKCCYFEIQKAFELNIPVYVLHNGEDDEGLIERISREDVILLSNSTFWTEYAKIDLYDHFPGNDSVGVAEIRDGHRVNLLLRDSYLRWYNQNKSNKGNSDHTPKPLEELTVNEKENHSSLDDNLLLLM
jgi:hypothetical protein